MNDLRVWSQAAKDLGLAVASEDNGHELTITATGDPDAGVLWVRRLDLLKCESGDSEVKTVDAAGAVAVLGRLARKARCQLCSQPTSLAGGHKHFGRLYR